MPRHSHTFDLDGFRDSNIGAIMKQGTAYPTLPGIGVGADWTSSGYISIESVGYSESHNMPPYEVAYCWKRTA